MTTPSTPADVIRNLGALPAYEREAIARLIETRAELWAHDPPHGPAGWPLLSVTVTKRPDGELEIVEGYGLPRVVEHRDPEHRTVLHEPGSRS